MQKALAFYAPERLGAGPKRSTKADVYAFAVLLLEMYSVQPAWQGASPEDIKVISWSICRIVNFNPFRLHSFPTFSRSSDGLLQSRMKRGERPPVPKTMPGEMQKLVAKCWDQDQHKRPEFAVVFAMLLVGTKGDLTVTCRLGPLALAASSRAQAPAPPASPLAAAAPAGAAGGAVVPPYGSLPSWSGKKKRAS